MKERSEEDPHRAVIDLIAEIAPHLMQKLDDIIDTVHRIGKKESGKLRQMMVQFTMYKYRDEIWKSTKNSPFCQNHGVRFVEDFRKEDRNAGAVLWPLIAQVCKEGKGRTTDVHLVILKEGALTHQNPAPELITGRIE